MNKNNEVLDLLVAAGTILSYRYETIEDRFTGFGLREKEKLVLLFPNGTSLKIETSQSAILMIDSTLNILEGFKSDNY